MEMGRKKGKETEERKCLGGQKSSRTMDQGLVMIGLRKKVCPPRFKKHQESYCSLRMV